MRSFLACFVFAAAPAFAATITVNEAAGDNDGLCSLVEAVSAANGNAAVDGCSAGSGADVIVFDASLAGVHVDLGGGFGVSQALTIDASAARGFSVSLPDFSRITNTAALTIRGVSFTDSTVTSGPLIQPDDAALTLEALRIADNTLQFGALIEGDTGHRGALVLRDVVIEDNDLSDFDPAFFWDNAPLTLQRVTFRNMTGAVADISSRSTTSAVLDDVTFDNIDSGDEAVLRLDGGTVDGLNGFGLTATDVAFNITAANLGPLSVANLVVDGCDAPVCVRFDGQGAIPALLTAPTVTGSNADVALGVTVGTGTVRVADAVVSDSFGGVNVGIGGAGRVEVDRLLQRQVGDVTRTTATLSLAVNGSSSSLVVRDVTVDDNVTAPDVAVVSVTGNGSSSQATVQRFFAIDCSGASVVDFNAGDQHHQRRRRHRAGRQRQRRRAGAAEQHRLHAPQPRAPRGQPQLRRPAPRRGRRRRRCP